MTEGIQIIFQIFNALFNGIFNLEIESGVSIGFIIISVFLIGTIVNYFLRRNGNE